MTWRVEQGDCIPLMAAMPEASVDAIVCDPPYGLEFMGKGWDGADSFRRSLNAADVGRDTPHGRASRTSPEYKAGRLFGEWCERWATEALRVLRPGGHLLAFGGSRTYHRLASGIEDAGFEIRDALQWLYGSGFPKSLDVSKAIDKAAGAAERWRGWGTALKPAHEPIVMARKPLAGTVAANVLAHGTGALNVDACRIGVDADDAARRAARNGTTERTPGGYMEGWAGSEDRGNVAAGRWPANVVLDEDAAAMLDEQSGELVSGANPTSRGSDKFWMAYGDFEGQRECVPARGVDRGGASRFFYVAKADTDERNAGLVKATLFTPTDAPDRNDHPTVKPIDVMRWLVRLVTPPGGTVLDPFTGSGTTGCATVLEGFNFIGIEREAEYVAIARARLAHWSSGIAEKAA